MENVLKNYPRQFSWVPKIENARFLTKKKNFVIVGMGGSHIAGDVVRAINPFLNLVVHKDYGIPSFLTNEQQKKTLFVLTSFSGQTEEVLFSLTQALKKGLSLVVISADGELLRIARERNLPLIEIPEKEIPPRMALGYFLRATTFLLNLKKEFKEIEKFASFLSPSIFRKRGRDLAKKILPWIPIVYASSQNEVIAQNFKIRFNETGKVPCFYNIIPEACHNEIEGFRNEEKSKNFCFLFLKDKTDFPRVSQRIKILKKVLGEKVIDLELITEKGKLYKIISGIYLADWAGFWLALFSQRDPQETILIERVKTLLKKDGFKG